jgi:hypothetical protein
MSWKFEKDKQKHLLYGLLLSLLGVFYWPLYALGFVAGVVKEIRDAFGYGQVELADTVYTWVGAMLGVGIGLFVDIWIL